MPDCASHSTSNRNVLGRSLLAVFSPFFRVGSWGLLLLKQLPPLHLLLDQGLDVRQAVLN